MSWQPPLYCKCKSLTRTISPQQEQHKGSSWKIGKHLSGLHLYHLHVNSLVKHSLPNQFLMSIQLWIARLISVKWIKSTFLLSNPSKTMRSIGSNNGRHSANCKFKSLYAGMNFSIILPKPTSMAFCSAPISTDILRLLRSSSRSLNSSTIFALFLVLWAEKPLLHQKQWVGKFEVSVTLRTCCDKFGSFQIFMSVETLMLIID